MNDQNKHSITIQFNNSKGLHANSAAFIVDFLKKIPRHRIQFSNSIADKEYVNARSVMGLLCLTGKEMALHVEGPNSKNIAETIKEFIEYGLYRIETIGYISNLIINCDVTEPNKLVDVLLNEYRHDFENWFKNAHLEDIVNDIDNIIFNVNFQGKSNFSNDSKDLLLLRLKQLYYSWRTK